MFSKYLALGDKDKLLHSLWNCFFQCRWVLASYNFLFIQWIKKLLFVCLHKNMVFKLLMREKRFLRLDCIHTECLTSRTYKKAHISTYIQKYSSPSIIKRVTWLTCLNHFRLIALNPKCDTSPLSLYTQIYYLITYTYIFTHKLWVPLSSVIYDLLIMNIEKQNEEIREEGEGDPRDKLAKDLHVLSRATFILFFQSLFDMWCNTPAPPTGGSLCQQGVGSRNILL